MQHLNTIVIELIILIVIALIFLIFAYLSNKNEKYTSNFYVKAGLSLIILFACVGGDCVINLLNLLTLK